MVMKIINVIVRGYNIKKTNRKFHKNLIVYICRKKIKFAEGK